MGEDMKIAVEGENNNSKGTFETKDKIKTWSTGKGRSWHRYHVTRTVLLLIRLSDSKTHHVPYSK
jgi:hypothetical protein